VGRGELDRLTKRFGDVLAVDQVSFHRRVGRHPLSPSPWDGASGHRLASAPAPGRVNKTPRIAPATMEPLLAWALRVVEDIGPDIRDAWIGYRQLHDGTHPSHQQFVYCEQNTPKRL
jgi:hypothetical protein